MKKRILIVDDDPDIGNMLAEVLAKADYETVRAYSGTEALLVLEKSPPDLILLDLMLPGLSGEQILPYLRDIPVIVLSAKAQAADKVELLMGGAVDYVTKPFHTDELLVRIAVHLRAAEGGASSSRLTFGDLTRTKRGFYFVTLSIIAKYPRETLPGGYFFGFM